MHRWKDVYQEKDFLSQRYVVRLKAIEYKEDFSYYLSSYTSRQAWPSGFAFKPYLQAYPPVPLVG